MSVKNHGIRDWFRQDRLIVWVLFAGFALRLLALGKYGLSLNLHSDDAGYTQSAIRFLQLGRITYHSPNEPTVHMMPGITFLLAGIFAVFGWGTVGTYAAKLVMILIGTAGILGIYLIGKRVWNIPAGLVAASLMALYIPGVLTDNLLLTETSFMTSFIFLVYYTLVLAKERTWRPFFLVVTFYLIALMFRPTVALYPLLILAFLLIKRYPLHRLWRQALVAIVILCAVLTPWWVRNYHDYHEFIPLDGGSGDPLLLGTYQGSGSPSDLSYKQILTKIGAAHPHATAFETSKLEEQAANARIKQWWTNDKASFLRSYLIQKPITLWRYPFYWKEILHVKYSWLVRLQPLAVLLGLIGFVFALFRRQHRVEVLLMLCTLLYYTVLYSWYFSYNRYSEPLMPFIFLGIGVGIVSLWRWRERVSSTE